MKRLLPLCLAMVMALSLTACGGKTPATGSASTTSTTSTGAASSAPTSTKPADSAPVLTRGDQVSRRWPRGRPHPVHAYLYLLSGECRSGKDHSEGSG